MVDLMRGEGSVECEFDVGREGGKLQHCILCLSKQGGAVCHELSLGRKSRF